MEGFTDQKVFEVRTSKTERPIPVIEGVHLHSAYNPEKEAEVFVSQNETLLKQSKNILIFGLGFGYHIKKLEFRMKNLYGADYKIFVIEPNKKTFQYCLENKLLLNSDNLTILNYKNIESFYSQKNLIEFMVEKPSVIPHPASFNLYEDFFKSFMSYKATTDIDSISNFIENQDLRQFMRKNYQIDLIDETLENIRSGKVTMRKWDHLLMAFNEIVNGRSTGEYRE